MPTSLITPNQLGQETKEFLATADNRSLTATIYSVSRSGADRDYLRNSGRVILNTGNLTNDAGKIDFTSRQGYIQDLLRSGVSVTPYSDPAERQRLHMKTYTRSYQGKAEAFISTGNLTTSGLSSPKRTYEERRTGVGLSEVNIGIKTNDPTLVQSVANIQRILLRGKAPSSEGNVLVGANATASLVEDINKIGKQGSITVGSAYIDDPYVAAALVSAKERGAAVNVITSNIDSSVKGTAGSGTIGQRDALSTLAAHGVNIYTPRADDPLLMHLKAVSITSADGKTVGYLGSHNLTQAARREDSVDLLIRLTDPHTAKLLRATLQSLPTDYDLIKKKLEGGKKLNKIEQRMYKQGTAELYKIDGALLSNYDFAAIPGAGTAKTMPFYPTVLPNEFFEQFKGRDISNLTLYSDLYKSRTGQSNVPESIQALDKALMTPGLGVQFNRAVGLDIYTSGQGVLGSGLTSIGRGIDYIFGYYDFQGEEFERKGKNKGSLRKFLGLQGKDDVQTGGPAETILSTFYNFGAGVAQAIAFYAAVNLPMQHLLGKLQEDTMMLTLTPMEYKGRRGQILKKVVETSRIFTYGPTYGGLINQALNQARTQAEATELLGKMLINPPAEYMAGLKKLGTDSVAERLAFGDERSYFKFIKGLRTFDSERFTQVMRPLFEVINPYEMGGVADRTYLRALDELQQTIGKSPTLQYKLSAENRFLHKFQFENVGVARISEIAKSFDKLGALLPLNLAYWLPALRNALDLPAFDPRKNLTWRDVFSIEETTKWVGSFYSSLGNTVFSPGSLIKGAGSLLRGESRSKADIHNLIKTSFPLLDSAKTVASLWKDQFNNRRLERKLAAAAPKTVIPIQRWQEIAKSTDPNAASRQLYIDAANHYDKLAAEVEDFVKEGGEFHSYKKNVDSLLNKSRNYLLGKDIVSNISVQHPLLDPTLPAGAAGLIKRVGTAEHSGVLKLKGALKLTGMVLLTDLALDNYLFKTATDFFTQLKARRALDTKDGTAARFEFTGTAPGVGILGAAASVGLATGLLFPNVIDVTAKNKGLLSSLIEQTDAGLEAALNKVYQQTSKTQAMPHLGQEIDALSTARTRLSASLNKIGRQKTLRFNYQVAWASGLATALFTNILFKGIAGFANFIYNRDDGAKLDSVGALISGTTEALVTNAQSSAQTRGDWVDIGLGKVVAESNLVTSNAGSKVYSVASQITTPFFQVSSLIKTDTQTNKTSLGVGFQLAPMLGLGFSPILPIGLKLNLNKKQQERSEQERLHNLSPFDTLSLFGRGLIGAVTGGANLTYESESPFLNNLQALGLLTLASSAVKPIAAGLKKYYPVLPNAAKTEIDTLFTQTQALRKFSVGGLKVGQAALEGMMTLPFVAGYGTYKATQKVFGRHLPGLAALAISYSLLDQMAPDQQGPASTLLKFGAAAAIGVGGVRLVQHNPKTFERLARHSRLIRRVAPYYLAFTMARLMSDPDSGYVGEAYKDKVYHLQATIGAGLGLGYLLDKSGVFMSNVDMASAFLTRVPTAERARLLENVFPQAPRESKYLTDQVDALIDTVIKVKPDTNVRQIWNVNSKLISQIAAPVLWDRALAFSPATDPQLSKYGLREGQLKSFTARLKLAGVTVGGAMLASNLFANLLSSEQLAGFYKLPVIGAAVRLLAGVEPESKLWGIKPDGVKGASRPGGLAGFLSNVLNKVSFGLISPQDSSGLYKDKSDPFLNILSPLGQSFRDSGPSTYFQAASPFSDLSVSSYKMGRASMTDFLRSAQVFSGREPAGLSNSQKLKYRLARIRGGTARSSAMRIDAPVSVYGLDAITSSGLKRELGIRQLLIDNLKYQRPGEVLFDLFKEGLATGALESTAISGYRLPRALNPLSRLQGQFLLRSGSKQRRDSANERSLEEYFQTAIWNDRAGVQATALLNFDVIGNSVKSLGGNAFIGLPLTLLSLGAVSYSAFQVVTSLAKVGQAKSLEDLIKSSRLFNNQNLLTDSRYSFSTLTPAQGGSTKFIQLDLQRGANKGYVLGLDTDSLLKQGLIKTIDEASAGISVAYKSQVASINTFFNKDFSDLLNKNLLTSTPDLAAFRAQSTVLLRQRLEQGYLNKVFGEVTYYEALFGQRANVADDVGVLVNELVSGKGSYYSSALDDLINEAQKLPAGSIDGASLIRRRVSLLKAFESSSGLKQLLSRIEAPLTGIYTPKQELTQFREITGRDPKQLTQGHIYTAASPDIAISHSSLLRELRGEKTWGQGAMTGLADAGKGAAYVTARYVDKGIPLYEVIEGAGLALDKSQPGYLQEAGKKSAVRSGLSFLASAGIAAGLTALGLPAIASLGVGLAAAIGFGVLVNKVAPLKKLEEKFTNTVGNLLFRPIETLGRALDPVGLGKAARFTGGLLTAPIGFVTGLIGKGINLVTRNITGPLLGQIQLGAAKDSLPMQFIKAMLLPQTAYIAELEMSQDLMQRKYNEIQNATSLDFSYPLHPLLLGRADQSERALYSRYFTSYAGGGRVLQSFGPQNYRISNLLNLALQRRQFLYESQVLGSTLTRINNQERPNGLGTLALITSGAVMANFGFKRLNKKGGTPGTGSGEDNKGGGGLNKNPTRPNSPSGGTSLLSSDLDNPNVGRTTKQVIKSNARRLKLLNPFAGITPQALDYQTYWSQSKHKLNLIKTRQVTPVLNKVSSTLNKIDPGIENKGLLRLLQQRATALFEPGVSINLTTSTPLSPFRQRVAERLNKISPSTAQLFKESLSSFTEAGGRITTQNKALRAFGVTALRSFYSYQATRSGSEYGLALVRAGVTEGGRSLINIVTTPIQNLIKRTDARLIKVGLNTFDLLDAGFTGLDMFMGLSSVLGTASVQSELNKTYRSSGQAGLIRNREALLKRIQQAKAQQLGSLGGNLIGTAFSFASPNPIYGLLGGGIATLAGSFGFFGLNKYLAERDYERALEGHAIYDPVQSLAFYLRTHRDFSGSMGGFHELLRPTRSVGKTLLRSTLNKTGKGLDFLLSRVLTPVISHGLALSTSLLTLSSSLSASGILGALGGSFAAFKQATRLTRFLLRGKEGQQLRYLSETGAGLISEARSLIRGLNKLGPQAMRELGLIKNGVGQLGIASLNKMSSLGISPQLSSLIKTHSTSKAATYYWAGLGSELNLIRQNGVNSLIKIGQLLGNDAQQALSQIRLPSLNKGTGLLRGAAETLAEFKAIGLSTISSTRQIAAMLRGDAASSLNKIVNAYSPKSLGLGVYGSEIGAIFKSAGRLSYQAGSMFSQDLTLLLNKGMSYGLNKLLGSDLLRSSLSWSSTSRAESSSLIRPVTSVGRSLISSTDLLNIPDQLRYQYWLWSRTTKVGRSWSSLLNSFASYSQRLDIRLPSANNFLIRNLQGGLGSLTQVGNSVSKYVNQTGAGLRVEYQSLIRGLKSFASTLRGEGTLIRKGLGVATRQLLSPIRGAVSLAETSAITRLNKIAPNVGRTVAIHGFKESLINVLSPAIDLGTFGVGAFQALGLNKNSSLAEVEQAYVTAGAARYSLVGSIFGMAAGGGLAEMLMSLGGQIGGAQLATNRALLRYEAQDYGLAPVLEDMVKPLLRDSALAGEAGKLVGTRLISPAASLYVAKLERKAALAKLIRTSKAAQLELLASGVKPKQINKLASNLALHERVVLGTAKGVRQGLLKQVSASTDRLIKIGAEQLSEETIKGVLKSTGYLAGIAGKGAKVLGPGIDMFLLGSGYQTLSIASNAAQYEVGARRLGGAGGSIAGGLIGGALAGPLGALVGSVIGDFIGNTVGADIGRRAYAKNISGAEVANFQMTGLIGGGILGALGTGALISLGLLTAPLSIPALAIGAGIGALAGMVGMGYVAVAGPARQRTRQYQVIDRSLNKEPSRELDSNKNDIKPQSKGFLSRIGEYIFGSPAQAAEVSLNKKLATNQEFYSQLKPEKEDAVLLRQKAAVESLRLNKKEDPWWKKALGFVGGLFGNLARGVTSFISKVSNQVSQGVKQYRANLNKIYQSSSEVARSHSQPALATDSYSVLQASGSGASVVTNVVTSNETATYNGRTITRGGNLLSAAEEAKLTPYGKRLYALIRNPHVLAMADVVARAEGTDFRKNSKNFGYSMIIGGSHVTAENTHPFVGTGRGPRHNSTASGRYQMMDFNYKGDTGKLFKGGAPSFSPAVQDLYFISTLDKRGVLDKVVAGRGEEALKVQTGQRRLSYGGRSTTTYAPLAAEYASLENQAGRGFYPGQSTPEGRRSGTIPFLQQRLAVRQGQSSKASTTMTSTSTENGVGQVGRFNIVSFSGNNNALIRGITGAHKVTKYEDLTPHWKGTGGYARAKKDPHMHVGYSSHMAGRPDQLVYDLQVSRNGSVNVPVLAAANGTIISAGGRYGSVVIKMTDGRVIRMLHNRAVRVKVGQQVQYGQPIGLQGDAGTGGGPSNYHIHIEAPEDVMRRYIESLHTGDFSGGKKKAEQAKPNARPKNERIKAMTNPENVKSRAAAYTASSQLPIAPTAAKLQANIQAAQNAVLNKVALLRQKKALVVSNIAAAGTDQPVDTAVRKPLSAPAKVQVEAAKGKTKVGISKPGSVVTNNWNLIAGYSAPGDFALIESTQGVVS